jgi:uncharacterized protein
MVVLRLGMTFPPLCLSKKVRRLLPRSLSAFALMNAESVWYLDSSAIVKLVAIEPETAVLSEFLTRRHPLVSSPLAMTEVHRAVLPLGERFLRQATDVLARFELVRVTNEVLEDAGRREPASLRSLNAIHLATAALFATLWVVSSHTTDGCAMQPCLLAGAFMHLLDPASGNQVRPALRLDTPPTFRSE